MSKAERSAWRWAVPVLIAAAGGAFLMSGNRSKPAAPPATESNARPMPAAPVFRPTVENTLAAPGPARVPARARSGGLRVPARRFRYRSAPPPFRSIVVMNALRKSTGTGKIVVELFSVAISESVCR